MSEWLKKHNIFLRIVSFFIAILIWFFVIAEINPDMESRIKGIDVIVTDVDHLAANGLAIVDGGNETVDIRVRGKRDKLVLVGADKFNVTASAAQITVPGTYKLNCNTVVDVDGVSVISKNPSQITVVVDRVSSKTVPVSIEFTGKMSDKYILENYSLSPDAVVVKGPQSQLENVKKAIIKYNVDYLTRSLESSLSYKLLDAKNAEVDMTELTVDTPAVVFKATVKSVKNVPLMIDLISNGVFSEDIVKCTVNPETIRIIGEYDTVNLINQIQLASVNIMNHIISGSKDLVFDIVLPNGVFSDNDNLKAEVSITAPGYDIKEFIVSTEKISSVEGYSYTDDFVTFKVFGRTDVLENLSEGLFTIDPASVQIINENEANVILNAKINNPEVVIIGDYSVLSEKS